MDDEWVRCCANPFCRRTLPPRYRHTLYIGRTQLDQARGDKLCRRLMTVPGVGPIVALTFRATVDQAQRFARSKTVGAHFGLAPRRFQSLVGRAGL